MSQPPPPSSPPGGPGAGPTPYPDGGTGMPPGPPAPPSPGGSGSKTGVIIGVVLAVALVIGGGVWFLAGGDGGDDGGETAASEGKMLHSVAMPKVNDEIDAMGMWTTRKNFVKTGDKEIVGYPLKGGKPSWKIPFKGDICWTSPQVTKAGLAAVLFKNGTSGDAECTQVGLVDFDSGKLRWQKRVADEWGDAMDFYEVTIAGNTVAAGGVSGGAAWSVEGRQLWKPTGDEKCEDRGYAGDEKTLIAVQRCGDGDPPVHRVQTLDPSNRQVKSSFIAPRGTEYVHVASVSPLLIAVDSGDAEAGSGVTDFLSIDDSGPRGKVQGRVDVLEKGYETDCPSTNVDGCTQFAYGKKSQTLYLSTDKTAEGQTNIGSRVVAIDMRTGKKKGQTELVEGIALIPFGVDEKENPLAYQQPTYEEPGSLWQVDAGSFKKKKLLQNPASSHQAEYSMDGDRRINYTGKRLYLGDDKVRRVSSESGGTARPLAMVFGEG
ncbi:hypothetical protein E0L36_11840 [Streptomyces sp. AJS327]|uniref:hypothetical protein n=1 Tax=Streptomyces sp. AJS327 TaxID=2545265 RepID=UPI0015E04FB3|nr:hypothetical protein [Streptomyces sp. AJS327]MBA0051560.1 hypothetical protein [Streptomyces sp. AJS327]